jgi:hypothetical protein
MNDLDIHNTPDTLQGRRLQLTVTLCFLAMFVLTIICLYSGIPPRDSGVLGCCLVLLGVGIGTTIAFQPSKRFRKLFWLTLASAALGVFLSHLVFFFWSGVTYALSEWLNRASVNMFIEIGPFLVGMIFAITIVFAVRGRTGRQ